MNKSFYFKQQAYSIDYFIYLLPDLASLCADYAFLSICEKFGDDSWKSENIFLRHRYENVWDMVFNSSICIQKTFDGVIISPKYWDTINCIDIDVNYLTCAMVGGNLVFYNCFVLTDLYSNPNDIFRNLRIKFPKAKRLLLRSIIKEYIKDRLQYSTMIITHYGDILGVTHYNSVMHKFKSFTNAKNELKAILDVLHVFHNRIEEH